jgi:hypothetical protein
VINTLINPRRHHLNISIELVVDKAEEKYGTVTAKTRQILVESLKAECLKVSGLPNEYTSGKTAQIIRDVKVPSHPPPTCQGPPPLMSRRDPVRVACHSPPNQVSSKTTPPRYHNFPGSPTDKDTHHDLSERSASQPYRHRTAAMSQSTPERCDTSKSLDPYQFFDARRLKSTPKSPPPGWHRPLPGEDATDIMVETEGVRAARGHHGHGTSFTVHTVHNGVYSTYEFT